MTRLDRAGGPPVTTAASETQSAASTVDPDLDGPADRPLRRGGWLHRRRRSRRRHADVVAAVGVGGALGTLARYGLDRAFPVAISRFPWTTLAINLTGSFLLGLVLYIVFERRPPSRLLRPFLAIGVLGGYTTFSTFAVEVAQRAPHHAGTAIIYVAVSIVLGPVAVLAGTLATRRIYTRPSTRPERRRSR